MVIAMSSELFDIVFSGKCDTGVKPGDAQRGLAALFKLSPEKVSHLFSGERITIKKNIDLATAMKYKKAMQKAGCLAVIAEVGVQKKQTLSERLGQTLSEPNYRTGCRA